jgi:hypothetical protein
MFTEKWHRICTVDFSWYKEKERKVYMAGNAYREKTQNVYCGLFLLQKKKVYMAGNAYREMTQEMCCGHFLLQKEYIHCWKCLQRNGTGYVLWTFLGTKNRKGKSTWLEMLTEKRHKICTVDFSWLKKKGKSTWLEMLTEK